MNNPFEDLQTELLDIKKMLRELINDRPLTAEPQDLLDIKEASALLKMSVSSLYKLTALKGIPFIKRTGSNRIIFSRCDVNEWLISKNTFASGNRVNEFLHKNLRVRKIQNN